MPIPPRSGRANPLQGSLPIHLVLQAGETASRPSPNFLRCDYPLVGLERRAAHVHSARVGQIQIGRSEFIGPRTDRLIPPLSEKKGGASAAPSCLPLDSGPSERERHKPCRDRVA